MWENAARRWKYRVEHRQSGTRTGEAGEYICVGLAGGETSSRGLNAGVVNENSGGTKDRNWQERLGTKIKQETHTSHNEMLQYLWYRQQLSEDKVLYKMY